MNESNKNNIQSSTNIETCYKNIFLANCIWTFHLIIILFVIFAPICNIPCILLLHITFCMSLLVHWYGNSNICSLSVLEAKLRGLNYTQSYTHQFIAPVYEISNTQWSMIVWSITILVLGFSMYKMYYSGKLGEFQELYKKNKADMCQLSSSSDISIFDKLVLLMRCFQYVFFR